VCLRFRHGLPFSVTDQSASGAPSRPIRGAVLGTGHQERTTEKKRFAISAKKDASGWFLFVRTPCPSLYPELLPTGTLRSGFRFLHRSVTLESATDVYVTTATHYSLESINREDFRMQLAHVRWDSREQRKEREVKQTSTR
jgi:hypothetical protein